MCQSDGAFGYFWINHCIEIMQRYCKTGELRMLNFILDMITLPRTVLYLKYNQRNSYRKGRSLVIAVSEPICTTCFNLPLATSTSDATVYTESHSSILIWSEYDLPELSPKKTASGFHVRKIILSLQRLFFYALGPSRMYFEFAYFEGHINNVDKGDWGEGSWEACQNADQRR